MLIINLNNHPKLCNGNRHIGILSMHILITNQYPRVCY